MKAYFLKNRILIIVSIFLVIISIAIFFGLYLDFQTKILTFGKEGLTGQTNLGPNQFFVGAPGSTIEYNIYLQNTEKTLGSYILSSSSTQGYYTELWRDIDYSGDGDQQLLPPQGANIELNPGEVAVLIVKVIIPPDELDGMVDVTTINVENSDLDPFDSVSIQTTVSRNLSFLSNWTQIGSDMIEDTTPERTDILALYYNNNFTHIFFRIAQAAPLDPNSFSYLVYMDTRGGGQQIGKEYYDFLICSDGIIWQWDGIDWIESGYPTYLSVEGTNILLWADLGNLDIEMQDVNIFVCSATRDKVFKDTMGPYIIPRDNISEVPLALIPIIVLVLYLTIDKKTRKK